MAKFRALSKRVHIPSKADERRRQDLIRTVIQAWKNLAPPRYIKDMVNYLENITKVEHNSGEWKNKEGLCSLRLPSDLMHSLTKAFNLYLPDEPPFAKHDDDIRFLYTEFPKLVPTGLRAAKGRKRKSS